MHIRPQQLGTRGVSMKTSWAAQEYDSKFVNLETMARFQQKQLQEKEQKLLQLYDQQQQRAYQVVQRGSAGSNGSHHGSTAVRTATTTTTAATAAHTTSTSQGGKVRQMFDERRQTTVKGIDRSYPLEPLENKLRKQANTNGVATQRNGNVTVNRQSVKRVSRADVNSNVNGGKPVVSYHEEITRESFAPSVRRYDDEDEYGVENRVATFANGYYRHEADNEQDEALDQETVERNRMMAKIHLMGFDETLKHRVRNDLESEEFPEYLITDVPDKLSKRNVTKKLSQAEERLERFKNANAKRSNMPKQSTSTSTVIRKRSEQAVPTKSNSRLRNEIAGTSPTSARSGSSWTSERSQRILENSKSPLPARTRIVDEMSRRRRESSDIEMLSRRASPRSFSTREATKAGTTSRIYPRMNEFKSLTSDGKIFVRRSASPQFFCRESERSGTTMSIDRKSDSSGSPLFYQETLTKQSRKPPFFLGESEQSRRTSESKSPVWGDRAISSRQSTSPQYLRRESKRSETAMSTDRETIGSKSSEWSKEILTKRDTTDFERKKVETSTSLDRKSSPFKSPTYEEELLKRRSTSPQFFCRESERSGTTMTIDRTDKEFKSPSYDREIVTKRSASPRFFLSESKQSRRTSESKSPIWDDRRISSRQSTSPQYLRREPKRSETAMSTDRETIGSKSSEWSKEILTKRDTTDFERKKVETSTSLDRKSSPFKSPTYEEEILKRQSTSPQFFCRESERSGTTMSIDRADREFKSPSYDREIVTKRSASPRFFLSESKQSRRTSESKSPIWDDRRISSRQSTSPQYLRREPKRSETAMSTDRETIGSKSSEWSKEILTKRDTTDFKRKKVETSTSFDRKSSPFKSPTYEEEILKRQSTSPQFFCRESERSGTTMSIDRADREFKSSSYDREIVTKRSASPRFFLSESKQSRRESESKSPTWSNREISSRQSTSPQYLRRESKRSETAMSTDRKTIGSKSSEWSKEISTKRDTNFGRKKVQTSLERKSSPFKSPPYKEEILKRRSTSPQFFCKESERSGTTMSIDHADKEFKSSSYDREIATKRSTSPRFFCRKSKRSGTTMSIDRKVSEPRSSSYDRKILTERSATPRSFSGKIEQRSAITTRIDREYDRPKSFRTTRDKRTTSPQFFCKESEKSATTMLIEPRSRSTDSTKDILKQRNYVSDISYKRPVKSTIDKRVSTVKDRHTPSPSVIRHEVKKASRKNEISSNITETRRSSKISETSATSASSIVSLKYGIEFDNIFQSTGLVRKFMKSQDGEQREIRQSPSKRSIKDVNARISTRGSQSRNRHRTSPSFQTARSPSIGGRKRATPEFPRKSITPTEVDMEIQEITMTDHRIERDKLQKAPSPISKRQTDGTYTKSSGSGTKFKTSVTYPVRKTHKQRESILESSVFKSKGSLSERSKRSMDRRSDRESEESAISLSRLGCSPVSESSRRVTTREAETKMSQARERTRKQSARNQAKYIATQSTKREDRQRASSRSPNQMRNRSAENRADSSPKAPDFSRPRKYSGNTVSSILYDSAGGNKRACTKFDQLQSLQSARLVQGAIKDRNLSADDKYNRGKEEDKNKNVAVDEVDAGIDAKYHTIIKTALNEGITNRIIKKKVSLCKTTQKPMKSSTSKKTVSPTRECGRRHDVRSKISPRVSPLRKTAEISHDADTPKISSPRGIVSKADQSSTSKFSTYTVEDRKREGVLVAKKLAESFDKMSIKCKTEEPGDSVRECSKVRRDRYEKNLERMDSVESALRRFDSIGAEFERSSPTSFRASPEISLQTIDIKTKAPVKESIASEGTTVPSREITDHTILRSTLKSPVGNDLKSKNAARKSDLKILRKETRSSRRLTRIGNSTESKRTSTKIRSPTCKRRLFGSDSEKEIQEERSKSSRVKARKDQNRSSVNFIFRKDEAVSNVRSSKSLDRDITRGSKISEETPTFSVKPLRSIEDIRKSIDNELVTTGESRSAIANRRSASREGVDARRSSPATNAARNVFLGADPARLTKVKSCVSRITKSPSPDPAATKQRETNARATRRSAPSSPSKSPDVAPRRATTDSRNQETKPSRRSTVAKGADSIENKAMGTGAVDAIDGVLQNGSLYESTTRKSDALRIDFDDRSSKEDDAIPSKKSSMKKSSNDKQQAASSALGRPTSSVSSNSSVNLIQDSSTKGRMAENERGKGIGKGGGKNRGRGTEKSSPIGSKLANASSFSEDATNDAKGLIKCKMCGRSFAQNRINLHEEICVKTTTKKRKKFDPVMCRVKGTELEPFVKKSLVKRETKTKKPETKSDWRRKHEEFINAIRYARETQARLAAGENLNDLPPPPPSDTSDYIQCEHCGRKFNRSAAERHVPICKRMHDKKQTQAPRTRR